MTNQVLTETQDRVKTVSAELTVVETALAEIAAATPAAWLEEAGAMLGALYADAQQRGDDAMLAHASGAWDRAVWLNDVAQRGLINAQTLATLAQTIGEQRNTALNELDAITAALDGRGSHRAVSDFEDAVTEGVYEYVAEMESYTQYEAAFEHGIDSRIVDAYDDIINGRADVDIIDTMLECLHTLRAEIIERENGSDQ